VPLSHPVIVSNQHNFRAINRDTARLKVLGTLINGIEQIRHRPWRGHPYACRTYKDNISLVTVPKILIGPFLTGQKEYTSAVSRTTEKFRFFVCTDARVQANVLIQGTIERKAACAFPSAEVVIGVDPFVKDVIVLRVSEWPSAWR
jgi:hypothetical protein